LIHPNKSSELRGIRFARAGERIIATDYPGGVVGIWDVGTGKRLNTIETGNRGDSFFITSDWKLLYTTRQGERKVNRVEQDDKPMQRWVFDDSVQCWDLTTGKLHKTFKHDPPRFMFRMRLSPDGNRFLVSEMAPGTYENRPPVTVSLWDTRTGKHFSLGQDFHYEAVFSPDGTTLATAAVDKEGYTTSLILLDTVSGKPKWSIPVKEKNAFASISGISPDGKLVLADYAVRGDGKDRKNFQYRWELLESATGKTVASHSAAPNEGFSAIFSPDGQTLAADNWRNFTTKQPKLVLFSIPENRVLKTISLGKETKGERLSVSEPAFSPDSKRLAVVTQVLPDTRDDIDDALDLPQPRIHLIDIATGEIRETLVAPQGFSRDACFSPDGRTLAVGGLGRILLWDVASRGKQP
jgi:WD40 repeat protein